MCAALSDAELLALAQQLNDDANLSIIAVALFGSYARGEATPYSDIDFVRFATTLPADEHERYTLRQRGSHLLSITTTTIEEKRREIAQPETAIFAVPGIRQAQALLDSTSAFAALQEAANAFEWTTIQAAADEYASELVMGNAEEAHKVLSALLAEDESTLILGATLLFMSMTKALAVQRGLLLTSENSYFRQVQQSAGQASNWTRAQRLAGGFDHDTTGLAPAVARGRASLQLYCETVALLHPILRAEHTEVIEATVAAIEGRSQGCSTLVAQ